MFFLAIVLALTLPAGTRAATHEIVAFSGFAPGTIVVKTSQRRLYFVLDEHYALRFPVGVGRTGMAWSGQRAASKANSCVPLGSRQI